MNSEINFKNLILYSIVAALGGLLFGFDIAIITGAGPFLTETFQLNSIEEGWAYSSLLFGCILGAAVAGWLADKFGRKLIKKLRIYAGPEHPHDAQQPKPLALTKE